MHDMFAPYLSSSIATAVSLHPTAVCNRPNSIRGGWIPSVVAELYYGAIESVVVDVTACINLP